MKPTQFRIILIIFTLLISGCKTIHKVSTTIHSNGSCTRTFIIGIDNPGDIHYGNFNLPLDSTWEAKKTVRKDIGKEDSVYAISRYFKNVSELNSLYQAQIDSIGSSFCEMDFEKHFYWFYTVYQYREKYKPINPYNLIPISDYLTPGEIAILLSDDDSLQTTGDSMAVAKKFTAWFEKTLFEEYFTALKKGIKKLKHSDLTWEMVAPLKDSLTHTPILNEEAFFDVNIKEYIENGNKALQPFLSQKALDVLREHESLIFEDFIKNSNIKIDIDDICEINEVTMPGLILGTNAETVQGNRVLWKTDLEKFYFNDYEMWVESRKVNLWTIWITGVLLILIFMTILHGMIKRRPNR